MGRWADVIECRLPSPNLLPDPLESPAFSFYGSVEMAPSARPRRAAAEAGADLDESATKLEPCSPSRRVLLRPKPFSVGVCVDVVVVVAVVGVVRWMRISVLDSSQVEEASSLFQKVAFGYLLVGITTVELTLWYLDVVNGCITRGGKIHTKRSYRMNGVSLCLGLFI